MDEETKFRQKFINFPSSFNLKIEELRKTKYIEFCMKNMDIKCKSDEFELPIELTRMLNVLTFLNWKADKRMVALELNKEVLEIEEDNIVARCNQIWMRREDGHLTESSEKLNKLESESNDNLLLLGNSEIAYSYSVFGPRYLSQSVQLYEELLDNIGKKDIPEELTKLWKFDLGIIYRKFCNIGTIQERRWSKGNRDDCVKKAAALLYDVASSDSPARWKGRCWASLGQLLYSIDTRSGVTKSKKELLPDEIARKTTADILNLALATYCKDSIVLKICGRHFRYLKDVIKAEELLKKSLDLRETAYAHHHLAIVLKQKLKAKISWERKSKFGNKYSPNFAFRGKQSHSSFSQQHLINKASAKGYDRVFFIPESEKEAVKEIVCHLDKAIDGGNEWASFEKGLILREINKPKEAFDLFLNTLKMQEFISVITTVSCEEQLGHCCRDLAKREKDPEKKRMLETDAITYWKKSIQTIAYKVSEELHFLKDGWTAYPTLKDLFRKDTNNITRLKELAKLSDMLEKHGETLDFYEQIMSLDEEQAKDPAVIEGKIQSLVKENQFEQAAVMLDLHNCTEGKDQISSEFRKFVYLECAFHLLSVTKMEDSGKRFRQAFSIDYKNNSELETDVDIFFLYNEEIENDETGSQTIAYDLTNKMKHFVPVASWLRITSNSDNVDPGKWKKTEQTQQMKFSNHIVLILDTNETPCGDLEYFIKIAQEIDSKKKAKLSLIIVDQCARPLELTAFPSMDFERKLLNCEDDFMQWIRKFLCHLLRI